MASSSRLKPVVVVIPERSPGSSCAKPLIVNGLTFDLSTPSRIIRINSSTSSSTKNNATAPFEINTVSHSETTVTSQSASNTRNSSIDNKNTSQIDDDASPESVPRGTRPSNPATLNTEPHRTAIIAELSSHLRGNPPLPLPVDLNQSDTGPRNTSHREVERRRKLKISTRIQQLLECLPYKILGKVSHGDVLEKVIEHIQKLKQENDELSSSQSAEGFELRSIHANLLLEHILLKELHAQLKREGSTVTSHATTDESHDDSHDMRGKSCNIQEKLQDNLSEEQHSIQSSSSEISNQMRPQTSTPESTQQDNVPQHRSNSSPSTHQSWPVMSLLSGTRSTSTSDSLSNHSHTSRSSTSRSSTISVLQRVSETSGSSPFVQATPTNGSGYSISLNVSSNSKTSDARTANQVSYPSNVYSSVQTLPSGSSSSGNVRYPTVSSSHRSSNTHQRAPSAHIVQPWVDGRSLTNNQQNQTNRFNSFQSVEIATCMASSTRHPALARRGLVSNCTSDCSPTNSHSSPAPSGGSLVSSSGHLPTPTVAGSRNTTDSGNILKPSQDLSMSMLTRSDTSSDRQPYTRYRPYTSRPTRRNDGSTHDFTQARQQSLGHETQRLSVHTHHSGQFAQQSGHVGAYSSHRFQHSIVDGRMSHDRDRMSHDSSYPVDYTNQPLFSFTGSNENGGYHHSQRVSSHDNHVMSYGTTATPPYPENQVPIQPTDGSVWRPYSEPHRMSGFGLSDILSQSDGGNHSLHLEPTPPLPANRMHSFLVDRLLDDI